MVDVLKPEQRSYCMSQIKGSDTKPELSLRKELWHRGLRYRLHTKLPGRPDLLFLRERVAVFVDGCFWHGCPKHSTRPQSNQSFWDKKLSRNIERDREVTDILKTDGFTVLRFWEHEIKQDMEGVIFTIESTLMRNRSSN